MNILSLADFSHLFGQGRGRGSPSTCQHLECCPAGFANPGAAVPWGVKLLPGSSCPSPSPAQHLQGCNHQTAPGQRCLAVSREGSSLPEHFLNEFCALQSSDLLREPPWGPSQRCSHASDTPGRKQSSLEGHRAAFVPSKKPLPTPKDKAAVAQ